MSDEPQKISTVMISITPDGKIDTRMVVDDKMATTMLGVINVLSTNLASKIIEANFQNKLGVENAK